MKNLTSIYRQPLYSVSLILLCLLILIPESTKAQNRNATATLLNNYVEYNNANIAAITALIHHLENYNSLFNGYCKRKEKLGGEKYSKEPNPFLDEDMFYINQDNPDFLYLKALKESAGLPAEAKADLNTSLKAIKNCSNRLLIIYDSLSTIFAGPLIDVEKDSTKLPYRLLFDAKRQLKISKKNRDELADKLNLYYGKLCPLTTSQTDYINSVKYLRKGFTLCHTIMTDLYKNDSTHISKNAYSLDSLVEFLDRSELTILKEVRPLGNSKHFPNKGYTNGFDLYSKYEDITTSLGVFAKRSHKFLAEFKRIKGDANWKFYTIHTDLYSYFNSIGFLTYFNEYSVLIGGGKLPVDMDDITSTKRVYMGWGKGKDALPERFLLLWLKETPRFDIDWSY